MKKININEIHDLILSKQEGLYWDFKQSWYTKKTRPKIVQDIICLANNILLRDAYIIIGVTDDYEFADIENDRGRLNTQQVIGFFRDNSNKIRFAGGIRPSLKVDTISICGNTTDVITIFSERHTPYYLEQKYEETIGKDDDGNDKKIILQPYHIYTREQDGNTPKDRCASINHVELLWKNRFGINASVYERYLILLDQCEEWEHDFGNKNYAFHKIHPEFRIETVEELCRTGWEPQAALYSNHHMTITPMYLMYHNTVVKELEMVTFDEYKVYLPWGSRGRLESVNLDDDNPYGLIYDYYCLDDFKGKLAKILTDDFVNFNRQLELKPEYHIHPFLLFENDIYRDNFEEFANANFDKIDIESIKNKNNFALYGHPGHGKSSSHHEASVLRLLISVELYKLWKSTN